MFQRSGQICFVWQFTASKVGKTGLTLTVDINNLAGTPGTVIDSDEVPAAVGNGVYCLFWTPPGAGIYVATAKTSDTTVDLKQIPDFCVYNTDWVANLDAAVTSRPSAATTAAAVAAAAASGSEGTFGGVMAQLGGTFTTTSSSIFTAGALANGSNGPEFLSATIASATANSITIPTGGTALPYGAALEINTAAGVSEDSAVLDHNTGTGVIRLLGTLQSTVTTGDTVRAWVDSTASKPFRVGRLVNRTSTSLTLETGGPAIPEGSEIAFLGAANGVTAIADSGHNTSTGVLPIKGQLATLPSVGDCYFAYAVSEWRVTGSPAILDAVSLAEPTTAPSTWTFANWLAWLVRRFAKSSLTTTTLTVFKQNGSAWTGQAVADDGVTQTIGEPS